MKKLTALFLAMLMIVSVVPSGLVFAEELPGTTEEGVTENHGPDVVLPVKQLFTSNRRKGRVHGTAQTLL